MRTQTIKQPAWLATLSESAQKVHQKEWQKQTAKKFTFAWVKEFVRGERSLCYAWLTWGLGIPALMAPLWFILMACIGAIHGHTYLSEQMGTHMQPGPLRLKIMVIAGFYRLFVYYVTFKCANNSRIWFRIPGKTIAVIGSLLTTIPTVHGIIVLMK